MEKAVFNALVLKVLIGQADIAPDLAAQLRKFHYYKHPGWSSLPHADLQVQQPPMEGAEF